MDSTELQLYFVVTLLHDWKWICRCFANWSSSFSLRAGNRNTVPICVQENSRHVAQATIPFAFLKPQKYKSTKYILVRIIWLLRTFTALEGRSLGRPRGQEACPHNKGGRDPMKIWKMHKRYLLVVLPHVNNMWSLAWPHKIKTIAINQWV